MDGGWDDVVVGAGSAGCCVARRLADAGRRVLLLEAGPGRPAPEAVLGVDAFAAMAEPGWTWPGGDGAPRSGRGVGGSSAINGLVAMVGQRDDYDRWERDLGCTGWSWTTLAPAFERARRALRLARHPGGSTTAALATAATAAGHPRGGSSSQPDRLGLLAADLTVHEGRRWSAADAYLTGAGPTLCTRAHAPVSAVLLQGRRAVGVALDDGTALQAGRVLVAAGARHSPGLLRRSGIDRPGLGAGGRDHPAVAFTLHHRPPGPPPAGPPIAGLLRWTSGLGPGDPAADLQLLPIDHLGAASGPRSMAMVALMAVRSSGTVEDPGFLGDELDLARLVAGVRHALGLLRHPAVAAVAASITAPDGTEAADLAELDDDELARWLPGALGGYAHLAGTCRMGPAEDPGRVVDLDGSVVGHPGLHVVDASVFPDLPSATTNLPVLAVAEHLAARLSAG